MRDDNVVVGGTANGFGAPHGSAEVELAKDGFVFAHGAGLGGGGLRLGGRLWCRRGGLISGLWLWLRPAEGLRQPHHQADLNRHWADVKGALLGQWCGGVGGDAPSTHVGAAGGAVIDDLELVDRHRAMATRYAWVLQHDGSFGGVATEHDLPRPTGPLSFRHKTQRDGGMIERH